MTDYFGDSAEQTAAVLERMNQYVQLAIQNGDAVYQDKPGQLVIRVRIKKEEQANANIHHNPGQ